jgi:hypothetical protein
MFFLPSHQYSEMFDHERARTMNPPVCDPELTNATVATPSREARKVLFASAHSIIDYSNGASVATLDVRHGLSGSGFGCRAFCTPRLDLQEDGGVERDKSAEPDNLFRPGEPCMAKNLVEMSRSKRVRYGRRFVAFGVATALVILALFNLQGPQEITAKLASAEVEDAILACFRRSERITRVPPGAEELFNGADISRIYGDITSRIGEFEKAAVFRKLNDLWSIDSWDVDTHHLAFYRTFRIGGGATYRLKGALSRKVGGTLEAHLVGLGRLMTNVEYSALKNGQKLLNEGAIELIPSVSEACLAIETWIRNGRSRKELAHYPKDLQDAVTRALEAEPPDKRGAQVFEKYVQVGRWSLLLEDRRFQTRVTPGMDPPYLLDGIFALQSGGQWEAQLDMAIALHPLKSRHGKD